MGQTYYEILGVAENATSEEIESAFRKRAREVHPDTVAPGNAYLRQVAAEAFKDLSEAKAVLLSSTEREKYDAKLSYERATKQTSTASSAQSRGQSASRTQGARSQGNSSRPRSSPRAQASASRSAPQRAPLRVTWKPLGSSLESFAFALMGVLAIFFVGWLMASGRTPPWWAVILTLGLGIASFRHGLKPATNAKVRGGVVPFLIGGLVVVAIFFSIWLPSTEFVLTRPTLDGGGPSIGGTRNSKSAGRFGSGKASASNSTAITVDERGDGDPPGLVTRIWKDVRDGKNYRTRSVGDVLFLEAVNGNASVGGDAGMSSSGIVHCDFHHGPGAGQDWSGVCSERNPADQSIRYASATVSTFSETRMEGSTMDIPEFLMVPVETVALGSEADRVRQTPEPDMSGLSDIEKQSIETACASDKLMQGPAEYNRCVQKQLDTLRNAPKAPDLSSLSNHDRDSIELVCSNAKLMEGPAAYKQCLARQLDMMKKQPR
jgi:hypothetical protein